jgi:hypothetical protein
VPAMIGVSADQESLKLKNDEQYTLKCTINRAYNKLSAYLLCFRSSSICNANKLKCACRYVVVTVFAIHLPVNTLLRTQPVVL